MKLSTAGSTFGISEARMLWDDEHFRARVVDRARELGKSIRRVLIDAGLSADTLDRVPSAGRRIDTLQKLATALDWSLPEIMGMEAGYVQPELLQLAYGTASAGLRHVQGLEPDTLIQITARVYNVLIDRQHDQLPISDANLADLARYIAAEWRAAAQSRPHTPPGSPATPALPPE